MKLADTSNIKWQPYGWAYACDFKNNDLMNVQTSSDRCGGLCVTTSGCTHFTWTTYKNGTCWMKKGSISRSDALITGNNSMVCGIVQ